MGSSSIRSTADRSQHHDADAVQQEWMILEQKLKALETRCSSRSHKSRGSNSGCSSRRKNGTNGTGSCKANEIFHDLRSHAKSKATFSNCRNFGGSAHSSRQNRGRSLEWDKKAKMLVPMLNTHQRRNQDMCYDYEDSLYDDDTFSTLGLSDSLSSFNTDSDDFQYLLKYMHNKRHIVVEDIMAQQQRDKKYRRYQGKLSGSSQTTQGSRTNTTQLSYKNFSVAKEKHVTFSAPLITKVMTRPYTENKDVPRLYYRSNRFDDKRYPMGHFSRNEWYGDVEDYQDDDKGRTFTDFDKVVYCSTDEDNVLKRMTKLVSKYRKVGTSKKK